MAAEAGGDTSLPNQPLAPGFLLHTEPSGHSTAAGRGQHKPTSCSGQPPSGSWNPVCKEQLQDKGPTSLYAMPGGNGLPHAPSL